MSEFKKWHGKDGINHCGGEGYCNTHKESWLAALKWCLIHKEYTADFDQWGMVDTRIIEKELKDLNNE